jgi:predicted acylesterase/phospholipase RssA
MHYDMVFEGGGAKGMVFVGAIQEIEKRGHHPGRLLGTSAGSIMATFLAAGYDAAEMGVALTEEKDGQPVFMGFLETPHGFTREEIESSEVRQLLRQTNLKLVPDGLEDRLDNALAEALATSRLGSRVFSFIERGGLYAADNFLAYMKEKLNSGTYRSEAGTFGMGKPRQFGEMTLAEFFAATAIDLSLVAADTTGAQMLILNHRTAPDCPVVRAVRMSMNLPLLWEEVVWQKDWGTYRGRDITGHTVVDGGLLSNFPIELFLSTQPQVTAVMGEKKVEQWNVLGFLIDETVEVTGAPPPAEEKEARISGLGTLRTITRVKNLLNTVTQAHDKSVIEAFERFVVRLPARTYGTIEFGMSAERREALMRAGQATTAGYFNRLEAAAAAGPSFAVDAAEVEPTADRIAAKLLDR